MHAIKNLRNGFSLVETVLALGIIAFAIVGLLGLLPLGLATSHNSKEEAQAANLISAIYSDLRSTPGTSSKSHSFQISPVPWKADRDTGAVVINTEIANAPTVLYGAAGQKITSTIQPDSQFRVTITYAYPAGNRADNVVEASIVASWPAALEPFPAPGNPAPQGSVEYYVTFPAP